MPAILAGTIGYPQNWRRWDRHTYQALFDNDGLIMIGAAPWMTAEGHERLRELSEDLLYLQQLYHEPELTEDLCHAIRAQVRAVEVGVAQLQILGILTLWRAGCGDVALELKCLS